MDEGAPQGDPFRRWGMGKGSGMRVVVTGATGNVGTSVIKALSADDRVEAVVGLARRPPEARVAGKTTWVAADVVNDSLVGHLKGADVVVHLAWAIQPSRDRARTHAINVDGSRRVFEAVIDADVPALVHASSVGVYSPGANSPGPVDETWPTHGISSSFYSADKVACERILDEIEVREPGLRVVRLRPALIFKRDAGSEIRRLFAGPLLPKSLLKPGRSPVTPWIKGLRFQTVHSHDVASAYLAAAVGDARGAFNIAATPILSGRTVAGLTGARLVELPYSAVRLATDLTWLLRLQPTPPGWVDMAMSVPMLSTFRAQEELGWIPRHDARETLIELLEGIAGGYGAPTPPLDASDSIRGRIAELVRGTPRS